MSDGITRRIIKPEQCVIGFGIPTSREGFIQSQASPMNRDFVVNNCSDLRDYEREVIDYTDQLFPVIERFGASVIPDLTRDSFSALFNKEHSVVILFAHWKTDSVEFADGLASIKDVIEAVPADYDGIIDLCVCHPEELALELRRARRDCVVKFSESTATPAFWLYFYVALFTKLQNAEMTYLDAIESTITDFQRQLRRKSWRDYIKFLRRFWSKLGL
jgi:hypothetical protein